ncbi:MAG TPA: MFS transporter [Candidatus Norongarragalinales archaeon]|nr:MFS transporter [Candidatus Norongarragalinales archaeon]
MSFKVILKQEGIRSTLFTILFMAIGFGIILPILPFYSQTFGATPFDLGMLTAIFALISLIFSPIIGKYADKVGRKKVLLAGTAVFSFSYILFAFAPSLQILFVARAIEALAAAGMFPICASLISDFTSEEQRGKAMALVGMTFSLGFILGPALGGLAEILSIQGAFIVAASLGAINFAFIFFNLKEPREKPESRDIVEKEVSLLHHISSPLLLIFASGMMIAFMIGGLQAVLALYTHDKMGFGAGDVGIIFTVIGILIMVFQFISGSLVSKWGEIRMIQVGMVLSALGFLLLVFSYDWLTLLLPLAILVLGNAFVFPSVSSLVSKRAKGKRGAVMGLVNSFQSLGQFVGPLLAGFLYTLNHAFPFYGLSAAVFLYCILFSIVEK